MPNAASNTAPTTAQLIRRSDASISRPTYAALGVALHHFTELLPATLDEPVRHRATTVLTKQVFGLLDDDDALEAIRRLVTDPDRRALPDGRTARDVCGASWDEVQTTATQRATASCEGAVEFGRDAIINLAAVRGVGAVAPWWGTPMWRQRVDLLPDDAMTSDDRALLQDAPELAGDELLASVLDKAEQTVRPPAAATGAPPADPAPAERAALAG